MHEIKKFIIHINIYNNFLVCATNFFEIIKKLMLQIQGKRFFAVSKSFQEIITLKEIISPVVINLKQTICLVILQYSAMKVTDFLGEEKTVSKYLFNWH